jgi:hypothetical protein
MLALSAFAIALVIGWSVLFVAWPRRRVLHRAPHRARLRAVALWLGWGVVAAMLAMVPGVAWPAVAVGVGLGLAGHAMLLLWVVQGERA